MNRRLILGLMLPAALCAGTEAAAVRDTDTRPVEPASLDITQADLFRTERGEPAFRIQFAAPPAPGHVRVLLDTGGPGRGEPASGADFLLEGNAFYRYPEGATDWSWNALGVPLVFEHGRTLTAILPPAAGVTGGTWFAETTRADLSQADRAPNEGAVPFALADLPPIPAEVRAAPEDLSELIENTPRSLSFLFEAISKNRMWDKADTGKLPTLAWKPTFMGAPLPVRLSLRDAVSGESAELEPRSAASWSNVTRWAGRALGVEWTLWMEPAGGDDAWLTGCLKTSADRCLQWSIGCSLDLSGWTWHEDVESRRAIEPASGTFSNAWYPFGVLASERGCLVVETDPDEPRAFTVLADPAASFFGVCYDLAPTLLTSNFPGQAVIRCALRAMPGGPERDAFRRALAASRERRPQAQRRRVPAVGSLLRGADPAGITNAGEFGFAFLEADGHVDFDVCRSLGIFPVAGAEPWQYEMPVPEGMKRTPADALRLLRYRSASSEAAGEDAASVLSDAARAPDGTIAIQFADAPASRATIAVGADPDLAGTSNLPLTRAMAVWRDMKRALKDERVTGALIRGMGRLEGMNYDPAAIGASDHPCTFDPGTLKPGLRMALAAHEFAVPAARALKSRGKFVMGEGAAGSPFLSGWVDVAAEEVRHGGPYQSPDVRAANRWRSLAGVKPVCVTLESSSEDPGPEVVSRHVEACMFWAFLPGFPASYWAKPSVYERDRGVFRTYMPVIRRLADAGWEPLGACRSREGRVQVENFWDGTSGVRHVTLRNPSDGPAADDLTLAPQAGPLVFLSLLDGACRIVPPGAATCPMALPAAGVQAGDVFGPEALAAEARFLERWNSGGREREACLRTVASVRRELDWDLRCNLSHPVPSLRGRRNSLELEVANAGDAPVEFSDFKIISSRHFRPYDAERLEIKPHTKVRVVGEYEAEDVGADPWLEAQWVLGRGTNRLACTRLFRPAWVSPVEFRPAAPSVRLWGEEGGLDMSVRNYTKEARHFELKWQGDFKRGRLEVDIEPGEVRALHVPVQVIKAREGQLLVEAVAGGETLFRQWFDVSPGQAVEGSRAVR